MPPTSTPIPPTATSAPPTDTPELLSCEEVEEICLELTFDGETCTYEGPAAFTAGSVALVFLNESEGYAAVNFMRHLGDRTIQDMIDYIGEEPTTKHHPPWSHELGTWYLIRAGESRIWEGDLEQGIHTMVCARASPFGVWFGTGLTVED